MILPALILTEVIISKLKMFLMSFNLNIEKCLSFVVCSRAFENLNTLKKLTDLEKILHITSGNKSK